ncbi:hypothetical protein [Clostridium sp.]|uniref:hypothetical protein n=1 Tax=Clostridium sp. TaxID=1506 RepID=UPI0028428CC2|nr:hypothetical protein [Clostridium sp.]MDR3594290.1 hypothetical protein [Clostridium sp.]
MNNYNQSLPLNQVSLRSLDSNTIKVSVRQNNFIAGRIILSRKIFQSAKREPKNLFRMFNNSLGINAEILNIVMPHFGIEIIEVPYLEEILKTTARKWITEGIVSPYCNATIDLQILLPYCKINMDHLIQKNDSYIEKIQQMNLFQ